MARAFIWPVLEAAAEPVADPDDASVLAKLDGPAFAATMGPELSRRFGCRISARLAATDQFGAAPLILARMARASVGLVVGVDRAGAESLVQRLFGARELSKDGALALQSLPPDSASWRCLADLVVEAVDLALAVAGFPPASPNEPPAIAARALAADLSGLDACVWVQLDLDGAAAQMLLATEVAVEAPDTALPTADVPADIDIAEWRRRARTMALSLDLPVSVRIADLQLPFARVAALQIGDVLPLEQPRALTLMVSGRRFAELPVPSPSDAGPSRPACFPGQPRSAGNGSGGTRP